MRRPRSFGSNSSILSRSARWAKSWGSTPTARKVVWVQEEPANMGALSYIRPLLERLLGNRHLVTVKRSESASPATGSIKAHKLEQEALMRLAFS